MTKSRIGFWLLISLIPMGLLTFLGFIISIVLFIGSSSDEPEGAEIACTFVFFASLFYWWGALFTGIGLKILSRRENQQMFAQAQRYAEVHGWQPISQSAWRALKADRASLAVSRSIQGTMYTLTIASGVNTTTVTNFATPLWALQFGDWLWERTGGENITPETAQAQRQEWSQNLAIIPTV